VDSIYQEFQASSIDSIKFEKLNEIIETVKKEKRYSLIKKYATLGIDLATKAKDGANMLSYQTDYAYFLNKDSSSQIAANYLSIALKKSKTGDIKERLGANNNLAAYYTDLGEIQKGTEAYQEAIRLSKILDHKRGLVSSTIGIVTLLVSQGMHQEAKPYIDESVAGCNAFEPPSKFGCLGVAYHNLGNYFSHTNELDSALFYANKSIEVKEKINHIPGIISSLQLKGNCELKLLDTNAAITTTIKAVELSRKSPQFKSNLISSLIVLGDLYTKTGEFEKVYPLWNEIESNISRTSDQINYFTVKINMLAKQNKYKEAFQTQKEQFNFLDSLRNSNNISLISEMENKFETDRYKLEKNRAEMESAAAIESAKVSRKNTLFITGFSILILILLVILISRFSVIKKQKKALNEAYAQLEITKKNELAVSNLKALQSQMNPHFIFNALNSVQDLVLLQDIRNSNKYLGKFSDLIRKILLSSKEQFISLEEEIEILSLYLDLEKLRFGDDFQINFKTELSENDLHSIELPAMFIQPYIENAIKHGLFHKVGQKQLTVHFYKEGKYLNCVVEDNGVGQIKSKEYKEKNLHLHTGFSTEAINDRIRLLNETIDKKILLETIDLVENGEPTGTKVHLQFPVKAES
jgi:tetratricopeptide (TPR) repeat protein